MQKMQKTQKAKKTPDRILIYLSAAESAGASWIIQQENGDITQSIANGHLDDLKNISRQNEIIVLIPAEDILLYQVPMPKLSRARLRQALPYAMEDAVLDDINTLHFAFGDYQTDGTVPVAVISKQRVSDYVNTLQSANLSPSALIPAVFALPIPAEHTWQVYTIGQISLVRTQLYQGFACDAANLPVLLASAQADNPLHFSSIQEEKTPLQLLDNLRANTLPPFINLLQGAFAAKRQTTQNKKIALFAAYALAAWLGIAWFSNFVSFFILRHQAHTVNVAIDQIYQRYFPHSTTPADPKQKMEQKLKQAGMYANKNRFLQLLAEVGEPLTKTKEIKLENLDFRQNQLTLIVSTRTASQLDTLATQLKQHGLSVKQQQTAMTGTEIKATLVIS